MNLLLVAIRYSANTTHKRIALHVQNRKQNIQIYKNQLSKEENYLVISLQFYVLTLK